MTRHLAASLPVLLILLAACQRPAPPLRSPTAANPPADRVGPSSERTDGLSAELRDPIVRESGVIEVSFVLTNHGSRTIRLAERWNSWGAHQWTFVLADAEGRSYRLGNPQFSWWANMFTLFEIPPGGEYAIRCLLTVEAYGGRSELERFVSERGRDIPVEDRAIRVSPRERWRYPVTLRGFFTAPDQGKWRHRGRRANWIGSIGSDPIRLPR